VSDLPRGPRVLTDEPAPTPAPPVPRGPRVLAEDAPAPRLDFGWEAQVAAPAAARAARRWSALSLAAAGLAVLLLGLSALDAANFVADQFARSPLLGGLTLAVVLAGYGLLLWALLRELRGLWSLHVVDRARAAFARGDYASAREETLAWAARTPAAARSREMLRGANDLDSLRAMLEAGPLADLDRAAAAAGRSAATQAFAATAVVPSPALDAVFFAWRGFRLVREVAAIHGLRPGLAGTLSLLRRAIFEAGTVAAADVAIDFVTRMVTTNPLIERVAGEAGKGAVAARRMIMLSRAAARACRILPPGRE
jgi:putative membrane protein